MKIFTDVMFVVNVMMSSTTPQLPLIITFCEKTTLNYRGSVVYPRTMQQCNLAICTEKVSPQIHVHASIQGTVLQKGTIEFSDTLHIFAQDIVSSTN